MGAVTNEYGTVHLISSNDLNKSWDPQQVNDGTTAVELAFDRYSGWVSDLTFRITPSQTRSFTLLVYISGQYGTYIRQKGEVTLQAGVTQDAVFRPLLEPNDFGISYFWLAPTDTIQSQTWRQIIAGNVTSKAVAVQADAPEGSAKAFDGRIAITKIKNLDTGKKYVPADVVNKDNPTPVEYYVLYRNDGTRIGGEYIEFTYNSTVQGSWRVYHMSGSSIAYEERVGIQKGNNNTFVIRPYSRSAGSSIIVDRLNFNWFNIGGTTVYPYLDIPMKYLGEKVVQVEFRIDDVLY